MSYALLRVPGAHLHVDFVDSPTPSGRPPLLLLHGGPGADSKYLRPQLDHLAELGAGRRVVFFDQRGAERSPLDTGTLPASYQTHVEDVDAVRRLLGVQRLSLGGFSWGGLLSLLYATCYPERVERLVLIAPAPSHFEYRQQLQKRMAAAAARPDIVALRTELMAQLPNVSPETARHWRFALAVAGYFVDPRKALTLTPFRVQQRLEEAIWSSLGHYDIRPLLPRLRAVPTLIVHGEDDVIPIASSDEIAELTGPELVRAPRCGHVPYIEAPEVLFGAVARFLETTAG